jgi:iron(III) transport system ATP-binding protein
MLRVEGLFTEYPNDRGEIVKAAQDVTFTVPEGKLFTLLGPSGCGKTTTLRSIAGLEKPRVGEIAVNDRVVYSSSKGVFVAPNRRGFGMVFQSYASGRTCRCSRTRLSRCRWARRNTRRSSCARR